VNVGMRPSHFSIVRNSSAVNPCAASLLGIDARSTGRLIAVMRFGVMPHAAPTAPYDVTIDWKIFRPSFPTLSDGSIACLRMRHHAKHVEAMVGDAGD